MRPFCHRGLAKLTFLVAAWTNLSFPQVVQSVSFEVVNDNTIEVTYYLNPSDVEQVYEVELFASNDGGKSYFRAKSVSGDVGQVSRSGRKKISWKVFSDIDSFEGEACVVKVIAAEVHTVGEAVRDLLFGSLPTKVLFDGIYFHGGWQKTIFSNATFKDAVNRGAIQTSGGFEVGVKYLNLPVVVECDYFMQTFKLTPSSGAGSDAVNHAGINISGNIVLFPIGQLLLPSLGVGYQASALYVGESPGENATSQAATNAFFGTVAGQIRLSHSFSVGIEYKKSVGLSARQWDQLIVFLSYSYHN